MPNYNTSIPGSVKDNRSPYAKPIWKYLTDEIGESGEVHQAKVSEAVNCSVRTVRKELKAFVRCNLVKIKSYNGQGRGIHLENLWLKRGKKIAEKLAWKRGYQAEARYLKHPYSGEFQLGRKGLDYKSIPNKVVTKGSRIAKYIMWKLRTWVENTHLKNQASIICGKLFNYFEGKSFSVAKKFLSRLKDSMLTDWSLTDFFVWFYNLINTEKEEEKADKQSQKLLDSIEKRKEEARQSWEENPPPKLSDYGGSFEKYLEAMEEWET